MTRRAAPGTGIVCGAKGCTDTSEKPFCRWHWNMLPAALKREWLGRDRAKPEKPLLSRMAAALEQAQFGERLL